MPPSDCKRDHTRAKTRLRAYVSVCTGYYDWHGVVRDCELERVMIFIAAEEGLFRLTQSCIL